MTADGGRTLTIATGDQGMEVLDAAGRVVGSYGSDRHEELVEKHQREGRRVAGDGDVAPAQVAGAPPPSDDDGTGDGFRELDLGNTGWRGRIGGLGLKSPSAAQASGPTAGDGSDGRRFRGVVPSPAPDQSRRARPA